ncbi:MAG: DNA/RNA non-specific endonuclease [Bacteroidales bacterium]
MKTKSVFNKMMLITSVFALAMMVSCEKTETIEPKENDQILVSATKATTTFSETFESGTKTSYAAAAVTLTTGSWYFDNALIGTSSSDRKSDSKSARITSTGKLTMQFNKTTGASTVSIYHAKYGSDGTSTWALYMSTNSGSSWTKVGSTITTSSTTLSAASFTVNQSGNVRFEIRKLTGTSYRINIDNISISDYSSGDDTGGDTGTSATDGDNMMLGNPSGAVASTTYANNYLMVKSQYVLSYNNSKHTCNWVSWYLGSSWIGSAARQDDFRADATLPSSWVQVGATDFSGSGFDRGHMCPSADRTSTTTDNSATFLMTNMIPQAPKNNQVTWANLENYCRSLVSSGYELYIISGPYGQGGTGSNGTYSTISSKSIVVPSYVWKIIVVLPSGTSDLSRITSSTRVIAVWMPNTQTVSSQAWGYYRTTIDYIESMTGYDFLSNVSTTIQTAIESKVDTGATS